MLKFGGPGGQTREVSGQTLGFVRAFVFQEVQWESHCFKWLHCSCFQVSSTALTLWAELESKFPKKQSGETEAAWRSVTLNWRQEWLRNAGQCLTSWPSSSSFRMALFRKRERASSKYHHVPGPSLYTFKKERKKIKPCCCWCSLFYFILFYFLLVLTYMWLWEKSI